MKGNKVMNYSSILTNLTKAEINNGSNRSEWTIDTVPILCEDGKVLPKAVNESTAAFNMASLASGIEAATLLSAPVEQK